MAKVLVTGASGFIGSHLVSALVSRGDEVTCLVRTTSETDALNHLCVRLVYGDVTRPESLIPAVAGQKIVYHLAGLTLALTKNQFFRVNRDGCRNIARACAAQSDPPVLVTVSSLAAAGPSLDGRPKIESDPLHPVSNYGWSKLAGEREVELFADRVPTTIVRPPIVLGERDRLALPMFNSVDKFGIHFVPGFPRHRFSLIHADDLSELIILAAQRGKRLPPPNRNGSPCGQGRYFAACEEDLLYDDLGRLIGAVLGRRLVFPLHVANPVVWIIAGAVEAISQIGGRPLYMQLDKAREVTAGSWLCSHRAATKDLGFSVKIPLAERLRQTAQWYRSEGWL
jgi:nucleoside-diphosphate-sugar epimerase